MLLYFFIIAYEIDFSIVVWYNKRINDTAVLTLFRSIFAYYLFNIKNSGGYIKL